MGLNYEEQTKDVERIIACRKWIDDLKKQCTSILEESLEKAGNKTNLSRIAAIRHGTIWEWEKGKAIPNLESIIILMSYLGIDIKDTL